MTNNENELSEIEIDVIGEVMNISMGAGATAMSTILDTKVNITTPIIEMMNIEDFEFSYLEPVIGVLIKYVEGIEGTNMLLLREADLKKILSHLLSMDPEDLQELDEISVSAICEIMNQMMGSAASALASFLGKTVNISPPEIMDKTTLENVRELFSVTGDSLVSIKFQLKIDGLVESEFISAMNPTLAKEIVQMSLGVNSVDMEEQNPEPVEVPIKAEPQASQAPQVEQQAVPQMVQEAPQQVYQQPQQQAAQEQAVRQAPKDQVQAVPYQYKPLGTEKLGDINVSDNNLDLIMSVPIQITVELGKTRKKIKDIAELTLGNIVELDRQAGDQVDVVANGKLIAKGDVVVVDDYYSVRITEIVKGKEGFSDIG